MDKEGFDYESYTNHSYLKASAIPYKVSFSELPVVADDTCHDNSSSGSGRSTIVEFPTISKFNRLGTHLATGYSTGKIVVHDFVSGCVLAALYWPTIDIATCSDDDKDHSKSTAKYQGVGFPISFLEWSKRGRSILVGSLHSKVIRLFDLTIPQATTVTNPSSISSSSMNCEDFKSAVIEFTLPSKPISLRIHPRFDAAGLVVLDDGQVAIFRFHREKGQSHIRFLRLLEKNGDETTITSDDSVKRQKMSEPEQSALKNISSACFLPRKKIEKFTDSKLLVTSNTGDLTILSFPNKTTNANENDALVEKMYELKNKDPVDTVGTHTITISRNGGLFCVLSPSKRVVRLYSIESRNSTDSQGEHVTINLKQSFKSQQYGESLLIASIHFSGKNHEYIVAGCNNEAFYELHVWNTDDGEKIDTLKGPSAKLNSINCHPNRPFISVASIEEGLVDIWGPCSNWTAFAPDFHEIHENVEYIKTEGAFDNSTIEGIDENEKDDIKNSTVKDEPIDICSLQPTTTWESDSDNEPDMFKYPLLTIPISASAIQSTKRNLITLNDM